MLNSPARRYDLDWLRVMAVLLLVPFHTALIFNLNTYAITYVKDQHSSILSLFGSIVHLWHMPLLFFISGAATWFSLKSRTNGHYLRERFYRLIVPTFFAILVLIPPMVFIQFMDKPSYPRNFLSFYPRFFGAPAPHGPLTWAHMWFVIYLFVFSAIALPILRFLGNTKGKNLVNTLAQSCEKGWKIFLFAVPLCIIEVMLRGRWPGFQNLIDDWANFFFYLLCFIYGYVISSDRRFTEASIRYWPMTLGIGITITTLFALNWAYFRFSIPSYSLLYTFSMVLKAFNTWFWIVAFLGLAHQYINVNSKALQYAGAAAYPFYILHLPVNTMIGYVVIQWNINIVSKFLIITVATVLVTIIIYDLLVKRTGVTRFLFGMRAGNHKSRTVSK